MDEYTHGKCGVCKVREFERNNYFHGKVLSARDLTLEQRYFNEKRWLLNRMVLGWGVVCGLDVALEGGALVVQPGLALDCCGHEILVCEPRTLKADAIAGPVAPPPHRNGGYGAPRTPTPPPAPYASATGPKGSSGYERPQDQERPGGYPKPPEREVPPEGGGYTGGTPAEPVRWVLCLEYRECRTEPVKTHSSCQEHESGREHNRIRDDYRLVVRSWEEACPDNHHETCCQHARLGSRTPLHRALVERTRTCPECEDCACVVLATGTVDFTGAAPEIALDDDHWRYRRIVHSNDALAGLLRCFHEGLPHITAISWSPESRYKPDEFVDLLCNDHLQVTFDQPMRDRTVTNVRSCRLSVFYSNEGGCQHQLIVPIHRIAYDDTSFTATYYFDHDCVERELRHMCRKLRRPADVELVLHGSLIHNEHGRALDAELIHEFPTGNGVEGGDFIAYFTVGS